MLVRNLEPLVVSRGARAWYRIVREAKGQIEARATELTERLHDPNRKAVEAKVLVQAVEKLEAELWEFEAITGKLPDEHARLLAFKRMLPKSIRPMLQTVEIKGYKPSKEYALKQAQEIRNDRAGGDSPGGEKAAGAMDRLYHLEGHEDPSEEDAEAVDLAKKGKGKGFKGECINCGKTGQRAADCWAKWGRQRRPELLRS